MKVPLLRRLVSGIATLTVVMLPWASAAGAIGPQMLSVNPSTNPQLATVTGSVWERNNSPITNGLLRLRDVTTGRIVMGTQSDAQGRFTFRQVRPGTYVVELVDAGGNVRAVGQVLSLRSGETVATFLRLGTEIPWFSGFFNNAAAAVLSTAALLGVAAVGNGPQPASARF